jgi:hypothetical protein
VTVRPGQFGELIGLSQTLGSAAGRTYALFNSSWAVLNGVRLLLTTTATAGSRNPVCRILDAAANPLIEFINNAALIASTPWKVNFYPFVGSLGTIAGQFAFATAPAEFVMPPFASMQIFDNANIDVNDTIQPNIVFAM